MTNPRRFRDTPFGQSLALRHAELALKVKMKMKARGPSILRIVEDESED